MRTQLEIYQNLIVDTVALQGCMTSCFQFLIQTLLRNNQQTDEYCLIQLRCSTRKVNNRIVCFCDLEIVLRSDLGFHSTFGCCFHLLQILILFHLGKFQVLEDELHFLRCTLYFSHNDTLIIFHLCKEPSNFDKCKVYQYSETHLEMVKNTMSQFCIESPSRHAKWF